MERTLQLQKMTATKKQTACSQLPLNNNEKGEAKSASHMRVPPMQFNIFFGVKRMSLFAKIA